MHGRLLAFIALTVCPLYVGRAQAVPPPGTAASSAQLSLARWIEHRVIPGERLAEISTRYRVEIASILEWNELDRDEPMLRAGQQLRIYTDAEALERRRLSVPVHEGDSWERIARRHDVALARLRSWNFGRDEVRPGERVVLWIEVAATPDSKPEAAPKAQPVAPPVAGPETSRRDGVTQQLAAVVEPARAALTTQPRVQPQVKPQSQPQPQPQPRVQVDVLPIVSVPKAGLSVGPPGRGRLIEGVQLPSNDALYSIRNPDHSWGSSHTVEQLQRALAAFRRDTGFDRELLVCDMSRKNGGRFRPHASHTSGRDIDIQLPAKAGVEPGTIPRTLSAVDWDATWSLVKALLATGAVKYIFLSRSRQRPLHQAALRAGASREELRDFIQYPFHNRTALVRHSSGHVKHLHVRFACAAHEAQCRDL